jgi:hypothetical protein
MSCGCKKDGVTKYEWTGPTGQTMIYNSLMAAKAKVHRKGGSYKPLEG